MSKGPSAIQDLTVCFSFLKQNHIIVARTGVTFFCYWCPFQCSFLATWRNHILNVHYGESYAHRINWENWKKWLERETEKLASEIYNLQC